jgi:TRAP-type C4-dicarboxylate transport system substrate-binding protein
MKKTGACAALFMFLLAFSGISVFAQRGSRAQETIEIRIASFMPRNSDWGRTLDRIAAEWARVTNNEVRLRVIHDGVEGNEAKMISSLAANNIQAALLTSFGLSQICPAIMTLSVPFLISNDAEFDLVWNEVRPILDSQLSRTNFTAVVWSKGGPVNLFSKDPVFTPDDLRRLRVGTNPDSPELTTVFKSMGFNMVETDVADLGMRLANNMINCIYQTPAAIAPLGLHRNLNHMMDLPIAHFMGAIVMNRATWNRLGPERQQAITQATARIATEFDSAMPRTVANAVNMMSRDGLRVNRPTSAQEAAWRAEISSAVPALLGTAYDREVYQKINETLEKARGRR